MRISFNMLNLNETQVFIQVNLFTVIYCHVAICVYC